MRSLALLVLLGIAPGVLGAQAVVPAHEEPRHRLVHEEAELRVLDVEIPPGDTTLFHRHDTPIAYVFISPTPVNSQVLGDSWGNATRDTAPLAEMGAVIWDETYATTPVEHRVTCLGNAPFRLIAVLNRGPGQDAGGREPLGPAGAAEAEGRWFRSTHHTLAAQETLDWDGHTRPVVLVQVSSGSASVVSEAGSTVDLRAQGDFAVVRPGAPSRLSNTGDSPVTLAVVEVR